nr:MAG TPA: hypothetical protein [Caudoviricetes sp.]
MFLHHMIFQRKMKFQKCSTKVTNLRCTSSKGAYM